MSPLIQSLWMKLTRKLGPIKSLIQLQTVQFTGSPKFNEDGSGYIPTTPGPQYVGSPSKEIDDAWEALTASMHNQKY